MEETKIEVSREGITFPYRRYLSDSASGFVLILLMFLFADKFAPAQQLISSNTVTEVRVFIFLLLFLLSTPIGVVINVISWMFLEPPQKWIEKFLIRKGFEHFKKEYNFYESMNKTATNEKNWFERMRYCETAIISQHPIFVDRVESLRGIAIFLRNLSLISFAIVIYWVTQRVLVHSLLMLFIGLFLLYVSAMVSFYFHVQILFWSSVFPKIKGKNE